MAVERKKILLYSALGTLFVLIQTLLFLLANFFFFYRQDSPFYNYAEICAAFLFFLLPIIFGIDLAESLWPSSWPRFPRKNWARIVAAHLAACGVLVAHYSCQYAIGQTLGIKRFENRFFQCLPYAPWPMQTSLGQGVADTIFQSTSLSWQYSWYTLEDICRLERLRASFTPLSSAPPHHCAGEEAYPCLLRTLEHLTGHAPLGTAGVVLAQDFLEEVRDFEWEKSKLLYHSSQRTPSQKNRSTQDKATKARQQLQILEQHLVRLLEGFDWAWRAGILSTVEFQGQHFPRRAIAALTKEEKEALHRLSKDTSASQWPHFLRMILSTPRPIRQGQIPIGRDIWTGVQLQSIDHYIRGEIFNSARNSIGIEGVATLQSMQFVLIHSPLPDAEKLRYTKHIQNLTKRYGQ